MVSTTATDRLVFTVLFSVVIHLIIVLGVSFDATSPPTNQPILNLEITLVKQQTVEPPKKTDFLAQANNQGGGKTEEKSPEPVPEPTITDSKRTPASTPESPASKPAPVKYEPVKPVEKEIKQPEKVITQMQAERQIEQTVESEKEHEKTEVTRSKPKLSARDLIFQAKTEIIRLEKKLDANTKALSRKPKKRVISSSTKEYAAAAYLENWRRKVERIGNLNYPQEAKRQRINGSLRLNVDVNPDGSVPPDGIVVSKSSGHKVLDDVAVKIVRLSAPFSAIPDNVLQGNDMLTIIRTWKFETNQGILSR